MHHPRTAVLCACATLASCAGLADAQLVFGTTTTTTTNGACFYLDVATNQVTTLWNSAANKKVNGVTADSAGHRLYSNDAARLNTWDYGSLGTAPTFIAGMYRTNDNVTFSATGVDELCWANGQLYGSTSFASTTFGRGIYRVSTVPDAGAHCVMTPLWTVAVGVNIVLGAVDYNTDDGMFYATNTANLGGTWTPGLYRINAFGDGAVTRLADFPLGLTNIDGLAIGGGKYWMTQHEPANSRIDIIPWDPATQTYGAPIFVPLTDATQRASGAAWAPGAIPGPSALALLGVAPLVAPRRRR